MENKNTPATFDAAIEAKIKAHVFYARHLMRTLEIGAERATAVALDGSILGKKIRDDILRRVIAASAS